MPARPVPESEELPHGVAEFLGGERVDSPWPRVAQTLAASALLGMLLGPFVRGHGGPGGWLLLFTPALHLGEGEVLVPELAGWRRDRMPQPPDGTAMTLTPDWVCEVLSLETVALDRGVKMLAYAQAGVRHLWLVDPGMRTLEVYRYEDEAWSLLDVHEASQTVRAEPFEALDLELGALWQL